MTDTAGKSLRDPLERVPGIQPGFAASLAKAFNIHTVADLFGHFPRRYEDRSHFQTIRSALHGSGVTILAKVVKADHVPTRSRVKLTKVIVDDGTGLAYLVFFNQWFVKKQFEKLIGQQIIVYGKAGRAGGRGLELTEVEWEPYDEGQDALAANRIVPIYPLSEGIGQARLRRAVYGVLESYAGFAMDRLPEPLRRKRRLPEIGDAWWHVHFPASFDALGDARRRLIYDEFFELQMVLALRRREMEKLRGNVFTKTDGPVAELQEMLPFALTRAQKRVIEEIAVDMRSERPMHRLVQGDVGSGKTVVAMAALLIAVRNGYQAALMAPTEILAEQHYLGVHRTLEALGARIVLLTGSSTAKERRGALAALAEGEADIAVGTHALIQESVVFKKLGLAVVDEQHRFGVMQRAALKEKGRCLSFS